MTFGVGLRFEMRRQSGWPLDRTILDHCVLMKYLAVVRRVSFAARASLITVTVMALLDAASMATGFAPGPISKAFLFFVTSFVFFITFPRRVIDASDGAGRRDDAGDASTASSESAFLRRRHGNRNDAENRTGAAPVPQSIHSTLPLDEDDEYKEIVADFIERLDARLLGMLSMAQQADFASLSNEAHWLKGSGGTVGFPALTEPATALMHASREEDLEVCEKMLAELLEIRQRMVIPSLERSAPEFADRTSR